MVAAAGPWLIGICGVLRRGRPTRARRLAPAVRFDQAAWTARRGMDRYDEVFKGRLRSTFWHHAQELLRCGLLIGRRVNPPTRNTHHAQP